MARLSGRVAIVTGAAQGIGATYALGLAAEGASVVLADVLDAAPVVAQIREKGGEALALNVDVTSRTSIEAMVQAAVSKFGRIDILVNNAALFGNLKNTFFADIETEEWDRVMAVNVRGVFECSRAVVPVMRDQGYGKIINIASGTLFKGTPYLLHYVASKGAVVAMTRVLARELGPHKICVNAIAPGLTMSEAVARGSNYNAEMIAANRDTRALKRNQEPEDLMGAVVFLASSESDFMTGQTMVIDGGSVMH